METVPYGHSLKNILNIRFSTFHYKVKVMLMTQIENILIETNFKLLPLLTIFYEDRRKY